jgi:aquaporin Z
MITGAAISVDVLYFTGGRVEDVSRWLARGLITTAVVYAFTGVSGAHANPVVTIAFALRRVFPARQTLPYIAAQFAGAFAAALLLWLLFGSHLALGASRPGPGFLPLAAMLCEIALTFTFTIVILMTAHESAAVGRQAAIAIGFVVAACGFAGGGISGASMNPARSLAAQVVGGTTSVSWVYVVGPLLGAVLAVVAHALLAGKPTDEERRAAKGI